MVKNQREISVPIVLKGIGLFLFLSGSAYAGLTESTLENNQQIYVNSLGMRFITIPAGQFLMGSSDAAADSREKPQHLVTFSDDLFMGQFEVTQADWLAVMGENPYVRDRSNPYYLLPGMADRITHPDHP
ncbi:MAG: SUMF1/EgtB/PvdO family nonheme iron enzyme, partial [Hafnia sp.]